MQTPTRGTYDILEVQTLIFLLDFSYNFGGYNYLLASASSPLQGAVIALYLPQ